MLPSRRPACRHRCQCHGRQAHPRLLSEDFRRRRRICRSMPTPCVRRLPPWPRQIGDGRSAPNRSPTASSRSRSRTWRTRSRRFRSSAAMTSPAMRSTASAAPAASMPAWLPMRSAWTSVLIHPLSSLLSAYGMGLADIRSVRQQAIEETFGAKAHATLQTRGAAPGARDARRSRRPGCRCRQDRRSMCARTSATPAPIRR